MARKDINFYKIATAQSLASGFTTTPTIVRYTDNISYQINITTTNSQGTFSVQVSDDYAIYAPTGVVENPGHWSTLTLSGSPVVAAANDVIGISLHQLPYGAVRLVYAPTVAGTGVVDIYFSSKQVGG